MKILFLDFDGVLNTPQDYHRKETRAKHRLYWRAREKLAEFILGLQYKKDVRGYAVDRKIPGIRKLGSFAFRSISNHEEFCPVACANIQTLLDLNPDLMIVVSSTWRLSGLKRCRKTLKRNMIDPKRVIDVTPRTVKGIRGIEIQIWLDGTDYDVTDFAIIDDDRDMAHLMDKLINTNGNVGFTWHKMQETAKLIGLEAPGGCHE